MVTQERHTAGELNVISSFDRSIAESIREAKPHWVIETGNRSPLSTLYHGYLLSLLGEEPHTLVSITSNLKEMPRRRNIYYIEEGIDSDFSGHLKRFISPAEKVMVILGAGGGRRNPLSAIQQYAPLVTEGSYLMLSEEVADFAMKNIFFEPDWTVRSPQVYLREGTPAWRLRSASLQTDPASPVLFGR
jgi:cephalosporin hydroxylase